MVQFTYILCNNKPVTDSYNLINQDTLHPIIELRRIGNCTEKYSRWDGQFLCFVGTVFCAGQLSCDQKSESRLHNKRPKSGMESGWPLIGFQLAYYMLGTTTKLSMLFKF